MNRDSVYDLAYQALTGRDEPWGGCDQHESVERIVTLIRSREPFRDGAGYTFIWSDEHSRYRRYVVVEG